MPVTGSIGGAKGVGAANRQAASTAGVKRPREEGSKSTVSGKALSKAEQEALAKREAARARVQQRTMQGFGLS